MNNWSSAESPSNIALIKYMGKTSHAGDTTINRSANSSLSFTLDHLRTRVRVRFEEGHECLAVWRPLIVDEHSPSRFIPLQLSAVGERRFLDHAIRCLNRLGSGRREFELINRERSLVVESANGFPSDCGLASSASSFSALTLAVAGLVGSQTASVSDRKRLADLSREGSGSSCRSFFSPWALWAGTDVLSSAEIGSGLPVMNQIRHLSIVVDSGKKAVSSSEAHIRVKTSLLFRGRIERAEERLRLLIDQLNRSSGTDGVYAWNRAAQLVWAEFWDMHALFETSDPPFGYFIPETVNALNVLRACTRNFAEVRVSPFREPLVTMDAGPNIHVLLWKNDETDRFVSDLRMRLGESVRVIDSKDFEND